MNQVVQTKQSEHALQKMSGHSIRSTKKKLITYAVTSNERAVYEETYTKPNTFKQFLIDLKHACEKGDSESKKFIEERAPEMASALQEAEEWDKPSLPAFLNQSRTWLPKKMILW